ncbi:MAG: CDP-diacylglycerol--glycerol-3-phosphate 3-phosphatidyltransferase [Deltaproteobacteria bacterium]|nr:CDP-diacylglycerol--glycerol-3-phosphate 3-phosphatidyltransferase [Deltaproteobacteria bacterium]
MAERRRTLRDELTDLPNLLTLGRVLVIPFVVYFIDNRSQVRSFVAMILYLLAAVTDFLDGFLARQRGQVSLLGKFLDPLADKLIVMAALVVLVDVDRLPVWMVVLLLARELAITGLRSIASSEGLVIAAGQWGKYKTALQLVGISFCLVHFRYPLLGTRLWIDFNVIGFWVLCVSLFFSLFSAFQYVQFFVQAAEARDHAAQEK